MSARPEWYHVEGLLMQAVQRSGWTPPDEPLIAGLTDWQELKRGGQGIVYSATQVSTRRRVAVKIVVGGPAASRVRLQRFEREIDVIAGFQHPHIVRLYDRGLTDQGLPYYVMELIDGCNLEEYLGLEQVFAHASSSERGFDRACAVSTPCPGPRSDSRPAPPAVDATLRLLAKVCDAVAYAHQRGVVHRDLKPGNILVDRADEPHVLDFGLAKNMSPAAAGYGSSAVMSRTGDFLGTLPWASPEQADGVPGRIDARSDYTRSASFSSKR